MKTEGRKRVQTISNSAATSSPSTPTNKTLLAKLEESTAGEDGAKTFQTLQMSDVPNATDADWSTKTTPGNDVSSQQAVRSYARQLLQSTTRSLNVLAKTLQEKGAGWKAQIKARKQTRELARDRSRLIAFSPGLQNQPYETPHASSTGPKKPAKSDTVIPNAAQISARIAVDDRDPPRRQAKAQPEDSGRTQRAQLFQPSRISADHERQQIDPARLQTKEAPQRKGQSGQRATITAEEERRRAELALRKAEDEANRAQETISQQQARIKLEQEHQLAEAKRIEAQEEAKTKAHEAETEQRARIKAEEELKAQQGRHQAELARLIVEKEKLENARAKAEEQARIKSEEQRQQSELTQLKAAEEINRKAQEVEVERQARIRAEHEQQRAQRALVEAEAEAKRKAETIEKEQQARIKIEEELRAVEIARVKAEEEAKRKAQAVEAEQQARIKIEEELRAVEIARVKAEEEAKGKAQAVEAEQQARVNAEQELQAAVARVKDEEEARKTQTDEAEQQARVKTEQERLTQLALRNAEEAKTKAQEAEKEHRARIKAEEGRQQSERARLRAEENARRTAHEAQAEQRARIKAEQELQQVKLARLEAEEAIERMALEVKAEQQAKIKAEQQRRQADAVEASLKNSTKQCPSCNRVFTGEHFYCLYDAKPLVDAARAAAIAAPKSPAMTGPTVLISAILTFFGIGILGFVATNYLPNGWWTSPQSTESEPLTNEMDDESIVVGGELNGKEVQLPKPEFPPRAKSQGATGKVTVAVMVDKSGTVTSARALNGHPLLQTTALAAARRTKFSAEKLNDQRGLTSGTITYNFK